MIMLTSEDIRAAVAVYRARSQLSRANMAKEAGITLKVLDSRLRRCRYDGGTFWLICALAETFGINASELILEAESISKKRESNAISDKR